jgi:hypothetical protein
LVASVIALITAYFDHGETWKEIKTGNKKCQNMLKLLALWVVPIFTIIGTIYLGIESVISDRQEQQHKREYRDVTNRLAVAETATQQRRIKPQQREKFIRIMSDVHNFSKIPIKVIIKSKDNNETAVFATQIREMLDVAGYGVGAKLPPDESYKINYTYVANRLSDVDVPPPNMEGKYTELVINPDVLLQPVNQNEGEPEVLVVFSGTIPGAETVPSIMPMHKLPNTFTNEPATNMVFAYHPTQDTNAILYGVSCVLNEVGISTGPMVNNGILKQGEMAVFIPERIY